MPGTSHRPVILIDDDETLCRLYGQAIEARGMQVRTAHSARDGLDLISFEDPFAILLDVSLPDSSGTQMCERMRATHPDPVPVLFLTAHDSYDVLMDGLLAGGDEFLLKGIDFDALMKRLQFWRRSLLPGLPPRARRRALALVEMGLLSGRTKSLERFSSHIPVPAVEDKLDDLIKRALDLCFQFSVTDPANRRDFLGYLMGLLEGVLLSDLAGFLHYGDYFAAAVRRTKIIPLEDARQCLADYAPAFTDPDFSKAAKCGRTDAARLKPPHGLAELCETARDDARQ